MWHSLGTPPQPATQIVGAAMQWLLVETADHNTYECCTVDGTWQVRYRPSPQLGLSTPVQAGDYLICSNCIGPSFPGSYAELKMPAPRIPLAQTTLFSTNTNPFNRYGVFGGAGGDINRPTGTGAVQWAKVA